MTEMETFDIENPPNLYKRGSSSSSNTNLSEEVAGSNDNIIFQEDSVEIGKKKNQLHKEYCGIRSDSDLCCILNLTVSAIGGGCFSFSYLIYEGGIIVNTFIFIFVTACVYFSIDLLRSFVVDTKYFSFALMTETILGSKWLNIYAFSSFVVYLSMVINYLTSIYVYIKGMHDIEAWLYYIIYYSIAIIIEIIICLYISKMNNMMHFLSIVSFISFFLIVLVLVIMSSVGNLKGKVGSKFNSENLFFPKIIKKDFITIILRISSYITEYVFAYSYHSTFPTVLGNLKKVNNKNTKYIHLVSFSIVVSAYFLIALFGFMVSDDIPIQLFKEKDKNLEVGGVLRKPFKILMVIYLLTLIPIRFIAIRDNYITLFGKRKIKIFSELTIIIIFILFCNLCVYGLTFYEEDIDFDIRTLIQGFGGIFGVIISFCLPVINFTSVNGKRKLKSLLGYIITGFFILVGILSFFYTINKIFNGNEETSEKKL